jgi:hypothetical protein
MIEVAEHRLPFSLKDFAVNEVTIFVIGAAPEGNRASTDLN